MKQYGDEVFDEEGPKCVKPNVQKTKTSRG